MGGVDCGAWSRAHSLELEISMRFGATFRALRRWLVSGRPGRGLSRHEEAALQAISAYLSAAENPWLTGRSSIIAQRESVRSLRRNDIDEIKAHSFTRSRVNGRRSTVGPRLTSAPDAAIESVVAVMPPLTGAILALRVHHDMSVADIAERFAIPRWKIRMHLRCAIRIVSRQSARKGMDFPG